MTTAVVFLLIGPPWLVLAIALAHLRARRGVSGAAVEKVQLVVVGALVVAHFLVFPRIWPDYFVFVIIDP